MSPVVSALAIAHDHGISHLDLKPANLFVLKDSSGSPRGVKLLDFGVAKVVARAGDDRESSGVDVQFRSFTPGYGAPEQFFPELGPAGPWTDVFALALVVVELITGAAPLFGATPDDLARAAVDPAVRPTPRTCGASVSDDVERVFRCALEVDSTKRFGAAAEFWKALELAVADELLEPFLLQHRRPRPETRGRLVAAP